jgi:hypothetical protein
MSDVEFERLVEPFCDGYCRYPIECASQDDLEEKCESCPIVALVERLEGQAKPERPRWQEQMLRTFLGSRSD